MSFSGSISNALSGMRASSLAAELVSSNLANATNESYAPRSLQISSRVIGGAGGVVVDGVTRSVDKALLAEWRSSNADLSGQSTLANYVARAESLFSTPDDPNSLTAKLAAFESSLVSASSRPDLSHRLEDVVHRAKAITQQISSNADGIQNLRSEVDSEIASAVTMLNDKLQQVADLNVRIIAGSSTGKNVAALQDLRQAALDDISSLVPIRVTDRDHGAISIMSTSGVMLLDGTAREIEFQETVTITEHMSHSGGQLSSLSMDGVEMDADRFKGSRLAALFELRDETLPGFQRELDAVARDLVGRFQDGGVDPTLGAADAGLFTDNDAHFATADETGLSRRIAVNSLVDPSDGGDIWKLRAGMNAATPGSVGDDTILTAMHEMLTDRWTIQSGKFAGQDVTIGNLSASLLSSVGSALSRIEETQSYAAARNTELTHRKFEDGVDSDAELQTLLKIEKAYAANAKVLQTVDEMLDVLMGL